MGEYLDWPTERQPDYVGDGNAIWDAEADAALPKPVITIERRRYDNRYLVFVDGARVPGAYASDELAGAAGEKAAQR